MRRVASSCSSCTRPRALRNRASKLCTPNESRLIPAPLKSENFRCSNVPGLASSVISASGASGTRARTAARMRSIALAENRLGVPPPKKTVSTRRPPDRRQREFEVGDQCVDVLCLRYCVAVLVRVEVAIRTLPDAPRYVDIQGQRWQRREMRRAQPWIPAAHRSSCNRAISARIAWPRCEIRFCVQRQFGAGEARFQVLEVRIVAETPRSSRRRHDLAIPPPFRENWLGIVGVARQREHAVVVGTPIIRSGEGGDQLRIVPRVGSGLAGVACGCTPGAPARALTQTPESSASAGKTRQLAGVTRLGQRVLDEGCVRFLRIGNVKVGLGNDVDAQRRQQPLELAQLAGIAGCDDQPTRFRSRPKRGDAQAHVEPSACICARISSRIPLSAYASRRSISAREKVAPSAVPCTSKRRRRRS